jgi:hypothetical protein
MYTLVKWHSLPNYSTLLDVSAGIIFLLDVLEVYLLAKVIRWIFDNSEYQNRLRAEAEQRRSAAPGPQS